MSNNKIAKQSIMDLQEYIGSGLYNASDPPIYLQTAMIAIQALEKQIPKNLCMMVAMIKMVSGMNGINGKPYELCPSCRTNLCCEMPYEKKTNYCNNCGQKLDWSEDNETD